VDGNDLVALKKAIIWWIQHQGFSHLNIQQACPSFKRW
jgi:hypothetical protein